MPTISDIGGGNNDYPDLISWGNARGSSTDLEIAHVYSDQFLTTDFDHRTDFTGGYEVVGMGNDFVGDFTDTGVIRITRDPAYTSWLIDDRTGRGHWRNLIIDCTDFNVVFRGGIQRFEATKVGFKGNTSPSFDEASVNFNGIFNQCAFFTTSGDAASFRYGQVTFNDCIAAGNANTLFGTVRIREMTGSLTNSIVHEDSGSLCVGTDGSTVTGSGCVTTDSSAASLSIGSQDSALPTYFENVSTGDLRINSAGQAALPTSLSWAYANSNINNYTFTINSGLYSLQGDNLSILSDRNLTLENGSYTLTGQELNLTLQRSITLFQGVYSQQGTDNLLLADRSLRLNTGDYLLDGSLLDLLLERSISLQSGEYNYLGSNINLQYGREFRLSLEQGSYSLQGSDTLLLKDLILTLDSSSYTYSADNISLLVGRKITTDSGNYSYSGSLITFIYESGGVSYTLTLDSGEYNLSGDSLKLLTSRRLPIDFGAYTYEGVDSKLLYNRVVALDSGLYSSAGTDLGIKVNRRLVFDNGNYSLQGTPITLSYTGEVLAILEGYNLSYKKHPVQSKYKTYNITARYN